MTMNLTSYDLKFARAIADYAGKEIEKANLMRANIEMARIDTEIGLAQKIQKSLLLKELPKVEGLDTFLLFQPASRISGDYYDLVIKPNGLMDFIIGDISGKGMPAALLMAMTLKVIRSVAGMDPSPTPDWIIKRSNEIFIRIITTRLCSRPFLSVNIILKHAKFPIRMLVIRPLSIARPGAELRCCEQTPFHLAFSRHRIVSSGKYVCHLEMFWF